MTLPIRYYHREGHDPLIKDPRWLNFEGTGNGDITLDGVKHFG